MIGLLGKKLGMTRVFDEKGNSIPVTVIQVGPCWVVQKRTPDKDGYAALQLGFEEVKERYKKVRKDGKVVRKRILPNKPMAGHFEKAGVPYLRYLREFRLTPEEVEKVEVGQKLTVAEVFSDVKYVDVTGTTKGRGYQGVVKRHSFAGGPMSHGTKFEYRPGGVGASTDPGRWFKNMKLPGHHGNVRRTVQNLEIVKIIPEHNLLLVRGGVPGSIGSLVMVKWAVKKYQDKKFEPKAAE